MDDFRISKNIEDVEKRSIMQEPLWEKIVSTIPKSQWEEWMQELFQGTCYDFWWDEENFHLPFVSFLAHETHCCHLDLNDPPSWIVLRAAELYFKN